MAALGGALSNGIAPEGGLGRSVASPKCGQGSVLPNVQAELRNSLARDVLPCREATAQPVTMKAVSSSAWLASLFRSFRYYAGVWECREIINGQSVVVLAPNPSILFLREVLNGICIERYSIEDVQVIQNYFLGDFRHECWVHKSNNRTVL